MIPSLAWYLAALAAMPIILAGVLWLARQDIRRTITVLAALALGIGLASDITYILLLKTAASGQDVVFGGIASATTIYVVYAIEAIILSFAWTLQSAAWVLALYHAIQARRGRWLALIAGCAAVSSVFAFFATNLFTLTYLAGIAPLSPIVTTHPYASLFAIGILSLLAAGATLLYARLGIGGVGMHGSKVNGLVPGGVSAPTREARAAALQADEAPEDVVFVVEDVPRGQGDEAL